jgi:hypothetical protein
MRKSRCRLRTFRLFRWQKNQQVWVATPEPGNQLPIAQNDLSISGAGKQPGRSFCVVFRNGEFRPAKH